MFITSRGAHLRMLASFCSVWRTHQARWRSGLFLWIVGALAAFLTVQLALTLIEELPRIIDGLK